VTKENPAPGIVAIHGYINSREMQDGFAIEFARRVMWYSHQINRVTAMLSRRPLPMVLADQMRSSSSAPSIS